MSRTNNVKSISENSEIAVPLKNIISLLVAVSIGTWGWFSLTERVNSIQHTINIMEMSINSNSEFRIKWPRGELGSLPADQRQDLTINNLQKKLELLDKIQSELNTYRVNIELLRERYEILSKTK